MLQRIRTTGNQALTGIRDRASAVRAVTRWTVSNPKATLRNVAAVLIPESAIVLELSKQVGWRGVAQLAGQAVSSVGESVVGGAGSAMSTVSSVAAGLSSGVLALPLGITAIILQGEEERARDPWQTS
jgi:hypothetical protein